MHRPPPFDLRGRSVLVAGGNRGLGLGLAGVLEAPVAPAGLWRLMAALGRPLFKQCP